MKKNIWMKIAAVILALVMWLFVMSKGQTEVSLVVPLQLRNLPEGLRVAKSDPQNVMVNIKGHERFIEGLAPGTVQVSVDLSGIKKGRNTLKLDHQNVDLPLSLKVVNIAPSSVSINTQENGE